MAYSPSVPADTVRERPVATETTVTVVPGSAPPFWSTMRPDNAAAPICAAAGEGNQLVATTHTHARTHPRPTINPPQRARTVDRLETIFKST